MKVYLLILTFIIILPVFGQESRLKNMVLIPKGEFNMGKNSAGPSDWQPEHKVKIDSFYLDKYEVTNKQYFEFCKAAKHVFPEFWGMKEFKMAGNVWEWVSDNYGSDYYKTSPEINPKGAERSRFKVLRGGSWHSGAMCIQNYYRNGLSPSWVDFAVGFRCAK